LISEKRPRHYANEILNITDVKDRRAALDLVPEHLQSLVKKHVEIQFELKKSRNLWGKKAGHKTFSRKRSST